MALILGTVVHDEKKVVKKTKYAWHFQRYGGGGRGGGGKDNSER